MTCAGTGTVTGTGGGGSCYPTCFLDLFADCSPYGAGTQQASGTEVDACYANGVKVSTTLGATGASFTYPWRGR
jgi:hypothetical protein